MCHNSSHVLRPRGGESISRVGSPPFLDSINRRAARSAGERALFRTVAGAGTAFRRGKRELALVGLEHQRMDVGFPADGRRVAEPARHRGERLGNIVFCLRGVLGRRGEGGYAFDRVDPRAKIFGGEVVAGDLMDVGVNVVGGDVDNRAVVAGIGEEVLAREDRGSA